MSRGDGIPSVPSLLMQELLRQAATAMPIIHRVVAAVFVSLSRPEPSPSQSHFQSDLS
jgi:hypothetical protein